MNVVVRSNLRGDQEQLMWLPVVIVVVISGNLRGRLY